MSSAAEAVADISRRRLTRRRRVWPVWQPDGPDRGDPRAGHDGPVDRLEQLRGGRLGARNLACRAPHSQDDVLLRGREQGLRAAVSWRGSRGGAHPAGHASRRSCAQAGPVSRRSSLLPASARRWPMAGFLCATTARAASPRRPRRRRCVPSRFGVARATTFSRRAS